MLGHVLRNDPCATRTERRNTELVGGFKIFVYEFYALKNMDDRLRVLILPKPFQERSVRNKRPLELGYQASLNDAKVESADRSLTPLACIATVPPILRAQKKRKQRG